MKKLCSLLLILALALGLAACGGSGNAADAQAPVPAPAATDPSPAAPTGPVSSWKLSGSSNSTYAPGALTLVLDADGLGYAALTDAKREFVYQEYTELTWTDSAIILDGAAGVYLVDGDTLTFTYNDETLSFIRSGGVPATLTPEPGAYTMTRFFEEGEEYPVDDSFVVTIAGDGSGTWAAYGEALPMTWNRYFLRLEEESFFYTYDGESLTVYDGEYLMICERN